MSSGVEMTTQPMTQGLISPSLMRMRTLADRIDHRPGWRYEILGAPPAYAASDYYRGPVIRIHADVIDSHPPNETLHIVHTFNVPGYFVEKQDWDDKLFFDWVWAETLGVERHEAREFFRVDGERYKDPHASTQTMYD